MSDRMSPEVTRREGVSTVPIRLADGRQWGIACPSVMLRPRVVFSTDEFGRQVEQVSLEVRLGYPSAIDGLYRAVKAAYESGSVEEQYLAFFTLAAALLRRAHDVTLETALSLLAVPNEELPALVCEVMEIVSGGDAMKSPAGGLLPASPCDTSGIT